MTLLLSSVISTANDIGRKSNSLPPVYLGPAEVGTGPAQVTTIREAARVAMHRTRRMTLLGNVPLVGHLVVPWLWPLHLAIVGATAGHIRHTPDASLSFCDGTPARRQPGCRALAALSLGLWLALAAGASLGLFAQGHDGAGWALVALLCAAPVIELLGLIEFALLNPEWLTLKRERRHRGIGRPTIVLTTLVSRRDGHDFAGRLIRQEFPQWHALGAAVIGYPSSKALVSYYVRMGARRERPGESVGPAARRRVTFDCRQPLRARRVVIGGGRPGSTTRG